MFLCMHSHACTIVQGWRSSAGLTDLAIYTTRVCFSFLLTIVSPSTNPTSYSPSIAKINEKVGKGLSYTVTVLSTGSLLRLWVAPRLTAYHTPHLSVWCYMYFDEGIVYMCLCCVLHHAPHQVQKLVSCAYLKENVTVTFYRILHKFFAA